MPQRLNEATELTFIQSLADGKACASHELYRSGTLSQAQDDDKHKTLQSFEITIACLTALL